MIDSHAASSRFSPLASVASVWFNWAWPPLVIHSDRSKAVPFQSGAPNQPCCDQGLHWPGKNGFIFKGWLIQSKIWKSRCFSCNAYECMHCELYHMIARLPVLEISDIASIEKPESLLLLLREELLITYLHSIYALSIPFNSTFFPTGSCWKSATIDAAPTPATPSLGLGSSSALHPQTTTPLRNSWDSQTWKPSGWLPGRAEMERSYTQVPWI